MAAGTMTGKSFGRCYGDGSGWEWNIAYERLANGTERLVIRFGSDVSYFDADPEEIRAMADALNNIADELSEASQ